jgi:hypothetical protein
LSSLKTLMSKSSDPTKSFEQNTHTNTHDNPHNSIRKTLYTHYSTWLHNLFASYCMHSYQMLWMKDMVHPILTPVSPHSSRLRWSHRAPAIEHYHQ